MKPPTIEEVLASPKLPSLPSVAVQIIALVQDPDVGLQELAGAISNDGALTGKILKTANSSFYARARGVSKLSDALMVLGLRRVKTLALGFSLVDNRRGTDGNFDYSEFWRRSLLAAVSSRVLAAHAPGVDAEEAFLGGLMHSLGVLALNQAAGPVYQEAFTLAAGDYTELLQIETEAFGYTHAEVGGRLSEKWSLPPKLTAALRWFPTPEFAEPAEQALVACVSTGSAASDVFVSANPGLAVIRFRDRCHQWFKIDADESDQLLARMQTDAEALRGLFDLAAGRPIDIGDILAQANEALEELSFEAEQQNVQLEREKTQLVVEASTDALTGLSNRRSLMEFLERSIETALRRETPLTYLMVDIDHFKRVNDTYGHPAGDEVLRQVALAIGRAVRDTDIAGRYGGEEFGVVAPETNVRGVVVLAQRLRSTIEKLEIMVSPESKIQVTVSVGVAALDPAWTGPMAQLIGAADGALYEAKEAGRNTVRIAKGAKIAA